MTAHDSPPPLGHQPVLDGIRGWAILAVLAVNSHLPFTGGWFIGVDIFFVLSGFLITTILLEEHRSAPAGMVKRFYLRRALRLLPALGALSVALALYALLAQKGDEARITFSAILVTLFYFANWYQAFNPLGVLGALGHAWSLSVEEQFYFVWPLLLLLALRRGLPRWTIAAVLMAGVVAVVLWRAWLWSHGAGYLRVYCGLDTRADALLVGAGCAFLRWWGITHRWNRQALRFASVCAVLCIVGTGTMANYTSGVLYYGGLTAVAVAAGVIVLAAVEDPASALSRALAARWLGWFGSISYGLYLWHFPVFQVLTARRFASLPAGDVLVHVVRIAVAVSLAALSFALVERPFLKLKKRFEVRTTRGRTA
jgi:peptidoglycan/LPS O-acetylase OafA/YrhL